LIDSDTLLNTGIKCIDDLKANLHNLSRDQIHTELQIILYIMRKKTNDQSLQIKSIQEK